MRRYVASQSGSILSSGHGDLLKAAAHLWVVAEELAKNHQEVRDFQEPWERPPRRLDHLAYALDGIDAGIGHGALYGIVIATLRTIESQLVEARFQGDGSSVELEPLRVGGVEIEGRALVWVRPAPTWRRAREDAFDSALERGESLPMSEPERPGRHLDRLAVHWTVRGPLVVPVTLRDPTAPLVMESGRRLRSGSFRLALCPLDCDGHPFFEVVGEKKDGFQVYQEAPFRSREALTGQLKAILEAAREHAVHLLVLPELMLDGEGLSWLRAQLGTSGSDLPFGVVAGSFHVWNGKARPENRSQLVDDKGLQVLRHAKRGRFRVKPREVPWKEFFHRGDELERHKDELPSEIWESIEPGNRFEFLETGFGRVALMICADAIDSFSPEFVDLAKRVEADLVLIPSMSDQTGLFLDVVKSFHGHGVGVAFVNAARVCRPGRALALCSLPVYRPKGAAPGAVAWNRGDVHLEVLPVAASREGGRHDPDGEVSPYDWLRGPSDERLGLVVDLGKLVTQGK